MVYCSKCGIKNEEDATFCKECGTSLFVNKKDTSMHNDKCEEECSGSARGFSIFWGVIIILIGLWVIFEFVLERMGYFSGGFPFWNIFALAIGILVIIWGFRIIIKKIKCIFH
jgi:ribosomal protein L40E